MRIWQIAITLGVESRIVMDTAKRFGIHTKSASTKIEPIAAQTLISVLRVRWAS